MSDWYMREIAKARFEPPSTLSWRAPRFCQVASCQCGAKFDESGWRDMPLVRVVAVEGGAAVAIRRCIFCKSEVSK